MATDYFHPSAHLHHPHSISSAGSSSCGGESCGVDSCGALLRGGGKNAGNVDNPFDRTDADLARQLNELSFEEREKVLEEIHGVADSPEESPDFLNKCLEELDTALTKIPKVKRKALDKALFLRPTLSSDRTFKIMFLRADYYVASKAAQRMIKFFEWKGRIFGEDKLVKDLTIDDLGEETIQAAILSGCSLQLPQKDNTGRPITMFHVAKFDHNQHTNMLRYCWYLFMSLVEHPVKEEREAAQLKGITNLTYAPKNQPKPNLPMTRISDNLKMAGDMMLALPVRITSYHFITDDPAMKFVLGIIRMGIGKEMSLRLRTHFGSEIEMQYSLLTFGIRCDFCLLGGGGSGTGAATKAHLAYSQRRRELDAAKQQAAQQQSTTTGYCDYPNPKDVLIGRGRPYHEFLGTRHLIENLIDRELDRYYAKDDRFWKTCINMEIVKQIEERGGRFLQRDAKRGWKVLKDTVAREKTANLFRYRYNMNKENNKESSTVVSASPSPPPLVSTSSTSSSCTVTIGSKRIWQEDGGFLNSPSVSRSNKKKNTLTGSNNHNDTANSSLSSLFPW